VKRALEIGESFVGAGRNAAHVNTVLGPRDGPAGVAWASALATPTAGHAPFLVVLSPGLPVQPPTLFVNKAALAGDAHAELTWGAAQAGVAGGVADALADAVIDAADVGELVLIAAVWVSPEADDAGAVYANNRSATRTALEAGRRGEPDPARVLEARAKPWNPFFRASREVS
jgi:5,6,7,8-tetrahydromethanopterin hydro-lyase